MKVKKMLVTTGKALALVTAVAAITKVVLTIVETLYSEEPEEVKVIPFNKTEEVEEDQ